MMLTVDEILHSASEVKIELLLSVIVLIVIRCISSLRKKRPKIPGPYPWPVIGNAASLGATPHLSMKVMAEKYGPVFLMKLGSEDVIVLNDYPSIKEALGRQREVFEGRPQFKSFAKISQGKGIAFNCPLSQGSKWRKLKAIIVRHLRKFISSPETQNLLSDHIRKESIEFVRRVELLGKQTEDGVVEPETMINVSIANIVCALVFGHRYDYDNKTFQDLVSLNRKFGDVVGAGSQVDVMPWIKIFPSFRKALKTFDFLNDRLNEWMKQRTSEHRKTYVPAVTRDLADSFIAEGIDKPNGLLKDDSIMALTTDVFGAAQDTLSTSLQWMLVYMMYFPQVQKKVHEELDSVIGDDRLPSVTDLNSFPYTTAVMHEVFRHSTFTSTTIPHATTSDTKLGPYSIPKGVLVFINQYAANHDPNYWDNPDEFRPERFLNEKGDLIPNAHNQYLFFSYGSRKCPGDTLSRMLLIHMIANIFSLSSFESDHNNPATLDVVYTLSNRPKFLRTKMRVRKPKHLEYLVYQLPALTPHVPTVDSDSASFINSHKKDELPADHLNAAKKPLRFSDNIIHSKTRYNKLGYLASPTRV